LKLDWFSFADLSRKVDLWDTSLMVEIMSVKLTELKRAKLKMMKSLGLKVTNYRELQFLSNSEIDSLVEDVINRLEVINRDLFFEKNRIMLWALNAKML